jgi:transcriptional regulator with XRE-family HTH domain
MAKRTSLRFTSNPEFAVALGMHTTMVSRLRNGRRSPSLGTFDRICQVLELTDREARVGLAACAEGGSTQAEWFAKYVAPGGPAAAAATS